MKHKLKIVQVMRHSIQLILFFALPYLYVLAFGDLKSLYVSIIDGRFQLVQALSGMTDLLFVIIATILFGRFFCGWLCAFGAYNDFLHEISKNLFRIKYKVNPNVDAVLKYLKYVILIGLIAFFWTTGSTVLSAASPWDAFAQITDFSLVVTELTAGFVLLVLITVGALFIERFFCRYLCPLGALFVLFSKIGIFKVRMPKEKCGACHACTNVCSMGIPLYQMDQVKGGECINCLKCVEACPRKNAQANMAGQTVDAKLASSVAMTACIGLYAFGQFGEQAINNVVEGAGNGVGSSISDTATYQKYADGTYTGTGTGFHGGTTTVSVTIKNDQITSIETVSTSDDYDFYQRAESVISDEIMSSQSTAVDTVSGATFSSNGIMEAVENALIKASASLVSSASSATSNTADVAAIDKSTVQTQDITDKTNKAVRKRTSTAGSSASTSNSTSVNSSTSTSTSGTDTTSNTTNVTSKYTDGTYTGSGSGFHGGTTTVSVTVSGGQITSIETVSTRDDAEFYQRAESTISGEIISAQSTGVDTVSGATFSSRGIISAVADALSQAV